MSWLYSRALAEEYLEGTSSGGEQFAQLSATPTPRAYCSPDKMTGCSRLSRFGMTFAPLTDDHGADLLTWFREDFLAKTSAPQEKAQELTELGLASGRTWLASLAKFDPATFSWRTVQPSLFGDSEECSVIWPRSGMTANGRCWALPMSALRTSGTESGLWPTPTASEGSKIPATANYGQIGLNNHPRIRGTVDRPKQVKSGKFPTPTAHNAKEGGYPAEFTRNTPTLNSAALGGVSTPQMPLNPVWVEWLMGWPLGWTDLKPLEMDRFQQWPQWHLGS